MQPIPQGAPEGQARPDQEVVPQLIAATDAALQHLMSILQKSKSAPPEKLQQLASIIEAFKGFVGSEGEESAPGVGTPEAGANPNARPAM